MKERFKVRRAYKGGVASIWGRVLRFMNLLRPLGD